MNQRDPQSVTETVDSTLRARRAKRWRYVERAFTLAAIFVVIVLAWSAIGGFVELFRKSPDAAVASGTSHTAALPAAPEPLLDFSRGGHWEMAGWQWKLGLSNVSAEDLESRWSEMMSQPLPEGLSAAEKESVDRLLEGIRKLPVATTVDGPVTSYTLDQDAVRIRVVTRREGVTESVVGLSAAVRSAPGGAWSLMTLESRVAGNLNGEQHILPLPQGTKRLTGRTDESGRIVFEVVQSPYSLEDLADYWIESGWEQQPGHLAGEGLASAERNYLFARNGEVVQAWKVPGHTGPPHRIALMRVSDKSSGPRGGTPDGISVAERASQ
jgi:hypothetical protein